MDTTKGTEVKFPATEKTLHKYAESIFTPVKRGESVTSVWVPMAGRRMWSKFLIENLSLFDKELPNHEKYLLVYIEPLDLTEESLAGYLRLIGKTVKEACEAKESCKRLLTDSSEINVFNDENSGYPKLLDNLKTFLKKIINQDYEVVLFLGEFDELSFASTTFYNNLKSLWGSLHPNLHYVFLMREEVTGRDKILGWGDFSEVLLQNVVYIPLRDRDDWDHSFNAMVKDFGIKVTDEQKELFRRLCGGHPYLLRVCLKVLSKLDSQLTINELEALLVDHYELQSVALGILEVHTEKTKQALSTIARGRELTEADKSAITFLLNMGLIEKAAERKYELFSQMFERAILGQAVPRHDGNGFIHHGIEFDPETGVVLVNGRTIEEKFTRQEFLILTMFIQNSNKLCSRDDIGGALWGNDSYEKYSEWAIDQLMSKLRRKLITLGINDSLVTIRGKGYKFITTSA